MKLVIALDGEASEIEEILRLAPVRGHWDGVEIPGYLVSEQSRLLDLLEGLDLAALMVRSMPDDRTTQHLPDARTVARKPLISYLREGVSRMAVFDLHTMSLDLGVNRIRPDDEDEAIDMRLRILRELMPLATAHAVTVCLPVRIPAAAPGARGERLTERLLHDLGSPNCRLVPEVILEECTDPPYDILRHWPLTTAAIRLIYEPELGIMPDADTALGWLEAAGRAGYRGLLIFSPRCSSPQSLIAEITRLARILS